MKDWRDEEIRLLKIQLCDKGIKELDKEHPLVKRNLELERALKNWIDAIENGNPDDYRKAIKEAKRTLEGK